MASRAGGRRTRPSSGATRSSTAAAKDRPTFISYTASGGGQVYIRFPINPWAVFGLTNAASRDSVKMAFRSMITQPQRQNRALASTC